MTSIKSEIRGAGLLGPHATKEYRALQPGQPLILTREPSNQKDPNAIIARTVYLQPVGYVARQQAEVIAPKMDAGKLWVAYVTAPGAYAKWADCELKCIDASGAEEHFATAARIFGASEDMITSVICQRFQHDRGTL